jgi:two-component system, cell cycle sensor histidine kinase PleC
MTPLGLKRRVEARDRLVAQAENAGALLQDQVLGALARGDTQLAEAAALRNEAQLREITENLRVYQAELHAQADELAASHERTEQVLNRFAALFADMPVAALLVSYNGHVIEHNAKAAALFKFRPRVSGVRFLHRAVQSDHYQVRVRPAFHEARATGASALEGVEFITESGQHFVGEMHIARLPVFPEGEAQFTCAIIDRTEHFEDLRAIQQSAEALRQSEAFLGDSARLARIGGWALSLCPRNMRWSKELRVLFEVDADLPGTLEATLARCAPRDRALLADAIAAAERGEAFEIEIDMHTGAGRAMRVLAVGHADVEAGLVTRVSGVFQDITGAAQARQQIGDLTERLNLAHDAGGIGIWDWDLTSHQLVLDERMQQLLGRVPTDGPAAGDLPALLAAHLHPEDLPLFEAAAARALTEQAPLNLELRRTGPGTAERWMHLTGRAHHDAQGHAVRLVGCAWDSSPEHEAARLRAARDAAESASRAKSAFLSRMSHELRTPLNAILGFSQLMRMEAEGGDLVLKPHRVTLIETAARHLLDLVNEVLDVSRIESGQLQVSLARFDIQGVLHEAQALLDGLAGQRGVVVHDHVADQAGLPVLADRLRLKEVLINLLSNAIKYNVPGGRVDVRAEALGEHVEITVSDSGRGLDADQLAGLFQPFNRLGAEATGVEGTGMGLFVSRRFMELMGGSIAATSRPGEGTCFTLRLNAPPPPSTA